jgi:hypothetical protein|tara:strand:+ start:352 stop:666 length:315 start_codon:yes stop_codon:yes gene_type:complete
MTNYHAELSAVMRSNPDLIFWNDGYQELDADTIAANKEAFDKVTALLTKSVPNFVRFQNFKPRLDGSTAIRCQTRWDDSFRGVTYIPLDDFKPESKTWIKEQGL